MTDELRHVGVMGMRWGHRKAGEAINTIRRGASNQIRKDAADLRKHGFNKEADAVEGNLKDGKVGIWPAKPNKLIRILAQMPGESNAHFDKEYAKGLQAEREHLVEKKQKAIAQKRKEEAIMDMGRKAMKLKKDSEEMEKQFKKSLTMKQKMKWFMAGDPRIPMSTKLAATALTVVGTIALSKLH